MGLRAHRRRGHVHGWLHNGVGLEGLELRCYLAGSLVPHVHASISPFQCYIFCLWASGVCGLTVHSIMHDMKHL